MTRKCRIPIERVGSLVCKAIGWCFPPRLDQMDEDDLRDSLGYQTRISRRGIERIRASYGHRVGKAQERRVIQLGGMVL